VTNDQVFQLALVAIGAGGTIAGSLIGALAGALYQRRLSGPALKVTANQGLASIAGQLTPPLLGVNAANVGPLPMEVRALGFVLTNKMRVTLMRDDIGVASLPADLAPGHSVEMKIFGHSLAEGVQEEADKTGKRIEVIGVFARDGTGKEWRGTLNINKLYADPRPR
jgi:hypothetical protein